MTMASCVICNEAIDLDHPTNFAKLTEKGCNGINSASKLRGLATPDIIFSEDINLYVHKSCRNKHTNAKDISNSLKCGSGQRLEARTLRPGIPDFDFKTHCFSCENIVDKECARKYKSRTAVQFSHIMTLKFQKNIIAHCNQR